MKKWKEKIGRFKKRVNKLLNHRVVRSWNLATRFENKKIEKPKKKKKN